MVAWFNEVSFCVRSKSMVLLLSGKTVLKRERLRVNPVLHLNVALDCDETRMRLPSQTLWDHRTRIGPFCRQGVGYFTYNAETRAIRSHFTIVDKISEYR